MPNQRLNRIPCLLRTKQTHDRSEQSCQKLENSREIWDSERKLDWEFWPKAEKFKQKVQAHQCNGKMKHNGIASAQSAASKGNSDI